MSASCCIPAEPRGLESVARDARSAGADVAWPLGDLAEPDTAAALVEQAAGAFGRLDALVHNAGFALSKPFGTLTQAELDHSTAVIRDAFFAMATAALPQLTAAPNGRVVAVSSFAAHQFRLGGVSFVASAAAKAGLEALVKALAVQLAPRGVTVNAVVPGFVAKDAGAHAAIDPAATRRALGLVPIGRRAQPDEVAATIAFLLSTRGLYHRPDDPCGWRAQPVGLWPGRRGREVVPAKRAGPEMARLRRRIEPQNRAIMQSSARYRVGPSVPAAPFAQALPEARRACSCRGLARLTGRWDSSITMPS